MEITVAYGAALAAILISIICRRIILSIAARFKNHFRSLILYPLILQRNKHTGSVNRLDLISLFVFLGANVVALIWPPNDHDALSRRASLLSLLNLIPLFLGGKTNPLMSFVGLSLQKYYFAHHWFGRVAAVEGLIHAGLSLYEDQIRTNNISISGYTVSFALIGIIISSLWFVRRLSYGVFLKLHVILSLLALGALVWHLQLIDNLSTKVTILLAGGFWVATTLFRFLRTLYRGRAEVDIWEDGLAVRAQVRLRRPLKVYPGCYFYLYFPEASFRLIIRGFPMNVAWWNVSDAQGSGYSSELLFLLHRSGSIFDLTKRAGSFRKVLLDGPYGQDLRLYEYENVILTAKGPGIVGVLPHALHLAGRRLHDEQHRARIHKDLSRTLYKDKTRKVDLFWVLDDNSQQRWLQDELRVLQKLDPKNKILCIWCIYPSPKRHKAPFQRNAYWRCLYPNSESNFYQNGIVGEIGAGSHSPGKTIVVSCGEPLFTCQIRDEVIRNASMEFAEVEYRPIYSSRPQDTQLE